MTDDYLWVPIELLCKTAVATPKVVIVLFDNYIFIY